MNNMISAMISIVLGLTATLGYLKSAGTTYQVVPQTADDRPIRLTIATIGPMLGPPTSTYSVGEQVSVTINMTNTGSQPEPVCVSNDLYQDLPTLTRNGKVVPYSHWQSYLLRNEAKDHTCEIEDLPDRMLLRTNEPTMVDFLVVMDYTQLPTGALSWYDQLAPGHYELSVRRRFGCCDGPMIQSNTVSFEVVPAS